MNPCDCTRGGPCNKVTLCSLEQAVEEAKQESTDRIDALEDALKMACNTFQTAGSFMLDAADKMTDSAEKRCLVIYGQSCMISAVSLDNLLENIT